MTLYTDRGQWGASSAAAEPPTRPPTIFGTWTGSSIVILPWAPLWCWLAEICTCSYAPPPPKDQDDPRNGERKPGGLLPHIPEPWLWETNMLVLRSGGSARAEAAGSVAQSCPTLCNSIHCSHRPWDSSARILDWVAISYSRGSSRPRDQAHISWVFHIGRWTLYPMPPGKPQVSEAEGLIISYPCKDLFAGSRGFFAVWMGTSRRTQVHSGWEITGRFDSSRKPGPASWQAGHKQGCMVTILNRDHESKENCLQ